MHAAWRARVLDSSPPAPFPEWSLLRNGKNGANGNGLCRLIVAIEARTEVLKATNEHPANVIRIAETNGSRIQDIWQEVEPT